MPKKYDVGIMGVWVGCNYGSIATYYALNRIITSMGYSVLMIDKPRVTSGQDVELTETHSRKFAREHYNISKSYKLEELKELNDICDTFVIGSDQVWNYGINQYFGKSYYFDYVEESKKKIAYASSFGHGIDFAPEKEIAAISEYMRRFDAVSVRESDGVRLLRDVYGIRGQQVLDPVFLADREIFDELAEKAEFCETEPYIATYILDPTPAKRAAMLHVAERSGYKLINMLDGLPWLYDENRKKLGMDAAENVTVKEWISVIKNSEFVITDSCHGVSFALLYEKNFIPFTNKKRGYSRFKSLADLFGFADRLITVPEAVINNDAVLEPMDYTKINAIMAEEKARCGKWLKHALETPKERLERVSFPRNITIDLKKTFCTGCGACVSVCPHHALSLQPDEFGYYRAEVDYDKCTGCGLCIRTCPALSLPENNNSREPDLYEFIAADEKILNDSSSGGIFSLLAAEAFNRNGVVAGAAWRDDFTVAHILIEKAEDLNKLQKSKYLQSYMGDIFRRVKEKLDNHVFVLFSGCPCQIAGLKAYLGKDYTNLIKVDLLCGNSPSAMFFRKYIEEDFPEGLEKYVFRHKVQGWNSDCVTVAVTTDRTEVRRGGKQDNYQRVYHNHTMCSPHCEKCKYQSVPRFGDLTIGDFWGIGKRDDSIDTAKGVSAVLCNNDKGRRFFESISSEKSAVKKKVPLSWLGGNGYAINGSHNYCSPNRDDFYKAIKTMPFSKAVNYALKPGHGIYPEQGFFNYSAPGVHFSFDPAVWEENYINGVTVLSTRTAQPKTGQYCTLSLPGILKAECKYKFKIKFKIKTDSQEINFHVKDSGSKYYQVICTHKVSSGDRDDWVSIEREFVPDCAFYDEFMIGASQLKGNERYIAVESLSIVESV